MMLGLLVLMLLRVLLGLLTVLLLTGLLTALLGLPWLLLRLRMPVGLFGRLLWLLISLVFRLNGSGI
jgi:hypothetical protein